SLNPWRKAATDKGEIAVDPGKPPLRTPTTGIAFCCALAACGVKIAPKANVLRKSRRLISPTVAPIQPHVYLGVGSETQGAGSSAAIAPLESCERRRNGSH